MVYVEKRVRSLPAGFTGVQRPLFQQSQVVLVEVGHLKAYAKQDEEDDDDASRSVVGRTNVIKDCGL